MTRGLFDPARPGGPRPARRGASGAEEARGRRRIWSVSELTRAVKDAVEERIGALWVRGEVADLSRPVSGHVYLTLKDGSSELRAVIWRSTAARLGFTIADGDSVLAFGRLTVYEPRGVYQMVIERAEPAGLGALTLRMEELKRRLAAEGLFDEARKRPIPWLPRAVGVVTSPTGAAVRDIIQVIGRRWPGMRVVLSPARVQGELAAEEIVRAIEALDGSGLADVMIVGRGGGSIEDLWAFNDERVARAIFACRIPVVSAVGHETDFTIADFVADLRAPTPSAAAERVTPSREEVLARLWELAKRLPSALAELVRRRREALSTLAGRPALTRPQELTEPRSQRLDELWQRTERGLGSRMDVLRERLAGSGSRLEGLSPLGVLARGYSLTTRAGEKVPLRRASDAAAGTEILTRLAEGALRSRVTGMEE